MRKVVARGAGAALMDHPDRIFSIIEAIRGSVSLPVTAKLRLGISPRRPTVSEAAQAAEEAGASMIAVHARFASSRHRGPADWEMLARVKSERRIPVIGNGGVATPADAFRMMSLTRVDGVMIGQAAIGHPWIFEQIGRLGTGQPVPVFDIATRKSVILDHFERLVALRLKDPRRFRPRTPRYDPENVAAMVFRAHLLKYVAGMEGAGRVRARLNSILSLSDIREALALVEDSPQESSHTAPLRLSAPSDTSEK